MKERGYIVFTTSSTDELHIYFIPESQKDLFDKLKNIYDDSKWEPLFGIENKLNEVFYDEVADNIISNDRKFLQAPHLVDGHDAVSILLSDKEILSTLYFRTF